MGIIAGVILGLVFRINYFASPIWCGFVMVLLFVGYLKPRIVFVIMALIAGMILAFFRASAELKDEDYVGRLYGQTVLITGTINGDPETDEDGTKIKLGDLRFGEDEIAARGCVYLSVNENNIVARADTIVVSGKLVEGFGTYVGYMYRPSIIKVLKPEPGDLVLKMRNWLAKRIKSLVSEPEVNLGLSYLLGMKVGLPDELGDNLRAVGLTHIVVASGAHLSILVEIARKVFGRMSRLIGVLFSIMFVVFFMAMVGWTPSIIRAGTMTILTLITWYSGRRIAPWRMIIMTMAFTLMLSPNYIFSLGWLLSFASYGGIMILGPRFCRFFYGKKKPGLIGSTILTTVAATLMTLPIILYYYGQISLISVVANLLILPTLPWAMGLVFMTGIVAGIPGVEMIVAWCATIILQFHIRVVEWFGGMRHFLIEIETGQTNVFWIYLIIALLLLIGLIRRKVLKLKREKNY